MEKIFRPKGVCSSQIKIDVENDIIKNVAFVGGCNGNTQGIARLCIGRNIDEVIGLLGGIKCGFKNTSCPDQLAEALKELKND